MYKTYSIYAPETFLPIHASGSKIKFLPVI